MEDRIGCSAKEVEWRVSIRLGKGWRVEVEWHGRGRTELDHVCRSVQKALHPHPLFTLPPHSQGLFRAKTIHPLKEGGADHPIPYWPRDRLAIHRHPPLPWSFPSCHLPQQQTSSSDLSTLPSALLCLWHCASSASAIVPLIIVKIGVLKTSLQFQIS